MSKIEEIIKKFKLSGSEVVFEYYGGSKSIAHVKRRKEQTPTYGNVRIIVDEYRINNANIVILGGCYTLADVYLLEEGKYAIKQYLGLVWFKPPNEEMAELLKSCK